MDPRSLRYVTPDQEEYWRKTITPKGIADKIERQEDDMTKIQLADKSLPNGGWVKLDSHAVLAETRLQKLQLPRPKVLSYAVRKNKDTTSAKPHWADINWPLEPWNGWDLQSVKDSVPYLGERLKQNVTNAHLAERHHSVFIKRVGKESHIYQTYTLWEENMLEDSFKLLSERRPGGKGGAVELVQDPVNFPDDHFGVPIRASEFDAGPVDKDAEIYNLNPDFALVIHNQKELSWAVVGEIKPESKWSPSGVFNLNRRATQLPELQQPSPKKANPIRQLATYCVHYQTPYGILETENEALLIEFWIHTPAGGKGKPAVLGGRYHWVPKNPGPDRVSILLGTYVLGMAALSRRAIIEQEGHGPYIGTREQVLEFAEWIELARWPGQPPPSDHTRRKYGSYSITPAPSAAPGSIASEQSDAATLVPEFDQEYDGSQYPKLESVFEEEEDLDEYISDGEPLTLRRLSAHSGRSVSFLPEELIGAWQAGSPLREVWDDL